MIVLDASVLIAHLDGSDAHHATAVRWLEEAAGRPLAASTITLAEVLVGPARSGRTDVARDAIERLGVRELPLGDDAGPALAELRATTGLKLPDCCVLHVARLTGARVLTFDARLAECAAALGLSPRPERG